MTEQISPSARAARWWYQLQPTGGTPNSAALAQLRRASTPLDALMHPAAVQLAVRLERRSPTARTRACELAAVLAHVRNGSNERSIAKRLGAGGEGARPMSSLRFRRLMQSAPGTERMTAFRRAVQMLGNAVNPERLAYAYLYWDDERHGEQLRTDWMFDYVGGSDDPDAIDTDQTEKETE